MATVKITAAMAAQAVREIDWAKIDAQTDAEIARNVAADPDAAPILTDAEAAAALVRTIRAKLSLTQADFAERYGIPVGTIRDWEQGRRQPEKAAFTYLRVIARAPDMVARTLAA